MKHIEYYLEPTKENYHTVKVKCEDGTIRYLHSKYYPTREYSYLTEYINPQKYDVCIILGIGLGYHLGYLTEVVHNYTKIICIDITNYLSHAHIPEYIKTLLQHPTIDVIFVDPNNLHQLSQMLTIHFLKGIHVIEHTPTTSAFPSIFSTIKEILNTIINKAITNHLTASVFGYRYFKNAILNLTQIHTCYPVLQLKNFHFQQPCIIVAPGPSLHEILEEIRTHQHCIYIIAVDSSVKSLLTHDIVPDYIVSIDPQPITYAHLYATFTHSTIITTLTAHPSIYHPSTIVSLNSHPICQLIDTLYPQCIGSIDSSTGSVLGDALNFAIFAGFTPILIAGADFSFPRYEAYHSDTEYNLRYAIIGSRCRPLETSHLHYILKHSNHTARNNLYTRKNFSTYRTTIDSLITDHQDIYHIHQGIPLTNAKTLSTQELWTIPNMKQCTKYPLPKLTNVVSEFLEVQTIISLLEDPLYSTSIFDASHITNESMRLRLRSLISQIKTGANI